MDLYQAAIASLGEMDWYQATGLVSGLLCVWLLIRQNVWNWPIGLVYAGVSLVVFARARLYADFAMHAYYVVMNAYGWWYWTAGKRRAAGAELRVSHIDPQIALWLAGLFVVATAAIGYLFDNHTDADLPYWDTSANVLSFIAMWMTARKYLENWYAWLVVDVALTAIYVYKGIDFYAVLYGIYLLMAVAGWWSWRTAMTRPQPG